MTETDEDSDRQQRAMIGCWLGYLQTDSSGKTNRCVTNEQLVCSQLSDPSSSSAALTQNSEPTMISSTGGRATPVGQMEMHDGIFLISDFHELKAGNV